MYGAIIGDIVGERYEFDNDREAGYKTKDFEFWPNWFRFTDDSVLTIAVADALMTAGRDADEETIKKEVVKAFRDWILNRHPEIKNECGVSVHKWLDSQDPQPYGSCGNGSAMRVSSVGWLYDSLEGQPR